MFTMITLTASHNAALVDDIWKLLYVNIFIHLGFVLVSVSCITFCTHNDQKECNNLCELSLALFLDFIWAGDEDV